MWQFHKMTIKILDEVRVNRETTIDYRSKEYKYNKLKQLWKRTGNKKYKMLASLQTDLYIPNEFT